MIIDTHCHLISERYEDMAAVLQETRAMGVGRCITQGTHPQDWEPQLALAAQYPEMVTSCLAIHPTEVQNVTDADFERMAELCRRHPQAAVGEAGLDYYWDAPDGWETEAYHARQRELLERHFLLAEELGLNISLHARDKADGSTACFDDAFAIARRHPKVRPVFHCFIGTMEQAQAVFDELDGMISFTGVVTFKKNEGIKAVAAAVPADRFMVETDAPFLSPEPFRGKLNIPGRTALVVEKLAELRGVSPETIAAQTTANAHRFFRLV